MTRLAFWFGGASLGVGAFIQITDELQESAELQRMDEGIITYVASHRVSWLDVVAVDITALGSTTLVVLHSSLALAVLLLLRDRLAALQLVTASAGAGILTLLTKGFIERARPTVVPRLVDISGFSYPSGHSLTAAAMYLTIGILVARHLTTVRARLLVVGLLSLVIGLIALSRVYLGVHYPSDIVSGVSLGAAWALLLAGGFSLFERQQHASGTQGSAVAAQGRTERGRPQTADVDGVVHSDHSSQR
jgi:undecaprenyl-diphosphatase